MASRTITITGGTLFEVAAREWGDATLWWRIAKLNKLLSPQLQGVVTLALPPRTPKDSPSRAGLPPPADPQATTGPTTPTVDVLPVLAPAVALGPPQIGRWGGGAWGISVWAS